MSIEHFFRFEVMRDGEGAGGGLGAAAAAAQQQQQGQQQQGQQGQQPPPAAAPPSAYVPEGLPESFKGANDRETIDKLYGHLAKLPKAPEKADAYTFQPPKELDGIVSAETLPIYRQVAHKYGLSQEQFQGAMNDIFGEAMKQGLIEPAVDLNEVFASLGDGKGDKAAQIVAGQKAVLAVVDEIKSLETRKALSKEQAALLSGEMLGSADAVRAVSALLKLIPKEAGQATGGTAADGPANEREKMLRAMYPTMAA